MSCRAVVEALSVERCCWRAGFAMPFLSRWRKFQTLTLAILYFQAFLHCHLFYLTKHFSVLECLQPLEGGILNFVYRLGLEEFASQRGVLVSWLVPRVSHSSLSRDASLRNFLSLGSQNGKISWSTAR